MTDERLEQLLRATFERDAARVPLTSPEWDDTMRLRRHSAPPPRRKRVAAVAVLVLAVVAGTAFLARHSTSQPARVASQPSEATATTQPSTAGTPPPPTTTTLPLSPTTTLGPPVTLPAPVDDLGSAPTTDTEGPSGYYRFAPDLDLAWIDPGGAPRLCWRTPIEERCIPEPVATAGEVATALVSSSSQHTVILVLDTSGGPLASELTVTLSNGETFTGPVTWDDPQLGIGTFRVDLPATAVQDITTR